MIHCENISRDGTDKLNFFSNVGNSRKRRLTTSISKSADNAGLEMRHCHANAAKIQQTSPKLQVLSGVAPSQRNPQSGRLGQGRRGADPNRGERD
jgi:hypothetical protein